MAFIGKESVTVTSLDSAESMSVVTDLTVDTNTLKVDSASNRVGILNATPGVSLDIGSATDAIHIPVGTTAERPGSPASGLFRYNTSLNQFEGYTSTWGAIGGGGTNTFTHDSFTGDDTTTDFVLSQTTESENNLFVFIDGVFQTQDAYSISTNSGVTTLSLSAAPLLDRKIIVYTVAAGVSGNNLNQNLFDANTTDAVDGINTAFTLSIPPVNKNNTQVFFDGVYQHKANYSISGSVLTFTDAPPLGVIVEVMIFTQTAVNVPVDNSVTSAKLSGDLVAPGNLTVTGYLAGPATFIIDPAAVGDNTGTLLVKGDLQVDGTQTIINSTTLTVDDLNITVASGAANALAADGAGITVDTGTDPDATITYDGVNDKWDFNKNVSVTGSVTADGLTVGDTSDSQTIIQMLANSTNGANTIHFGDAASGAASYVGYINYAHDSNSMQFSANGSERLRIDSAGSTIIKSGNKLILNRTDNAIGGEMSYVAGTGFIFNDANGDGVSFNQGVANKVRITSPGNVGIGTDSPDTLLHLSGDATAIIRLENTNAGLALNSVLGSIEFEKQDASGAGVGVAGSVKLISSNASGAESSLVFSTSSTARGNNAEAMRIDGSGNVGISTNDPVETLSIGATPSVAGFSLGYAVSQVFLRYNNYFSGTAQVSDVTKGSASISLGRSSDGVITFNTAAAGAGAPSETMRIAADGNVGIGNTNPSAFNSLGGKSLVVGDGAGTNNLTLFSDDTADANGYGHVAFADSNVSSSTAQYAGLIQYFHGDDTMRFYTNASEKVRIDDSGNVGIGEINPVQKFQISADAGAARMSFERTNANTTGGIGSIQWNALDGHAVAGVMAYGDGNDEGAHLVFNTTSTASSSDVYVSTTERMRIDSSGKVFISGGPTTGGTAQEFSVVYAADSGYYSTFGSVGQWEHYRGDGSNGGLAIKTDLSSGVWGSGGGFITFSPRATQVLKLEHDNVVFNEDGGDMDFRVESAGNDHMLFVDGGNSRVNVNGDGPGLSSLNVRDSLAVTNTAGNQRILMGNQDSAGVDNPSIIASANGRISLGNGDTWNSTSGGNFTDRFSVQASEVVVNEDGNDTNFRVESVGNANMLFVDAGNNVVNIGTSGLSATGAKLAVQGPAVFNTDTGTNKVFISRSGDTNQAGSMYTDDATFIFDSIQDEVGLSFGGFLFRGTNATTANAKLLELNQTGAVFNDDGGDMDFRVESVGNANMLFVDAGNNSVGIGTSSVESTLHLQAASAGGRGATLTIDNNATSTVGNESQITFLTDAGASVAAIANARIKAISTNAGDGRADLTFTTWNGSAEGERMRIDALGNVGIGVVPSAWRSNEASIDIGRYSTSTSVGNYSNGGSLLAYNTFISTSGQFTRKATGFSTTYNTFNGVHEWTSDASAAVGAFTPTPRMRIDASGNLLLGTTTTPTDAGLAVGSTTTGKNISVFSSANGTNGLISVHQSNGTSEGIIYAGTGDINVFGTSKVKVIAAGNGVELTNGATSWTAISDERKKDIIEPITNAAQKVSTLRSVIGKYKTDSEGTRRSFLIAQDVQAVLPEAVDASDENELGLRYTETIPLLVAAIQEQQEQIEQLKADIAVLKGDN